MTTLGPPPPPFTYQDEDWLVSITVKVRFIKPGVRGYFTGSGIIVRTNARGAFILTNYHVTEFTDEIEIRSTGPTGSNNFFTAKHIWSAFTTRGMTGRAHDLAVYFCEHDTLFTNVVTPRIVNPRTTTGQSLVGENIMTRGWPNGRNARTGGTITGLKRREISGIFPEPTVHYTETMLPCTTVDYVNAGWSGGAVILTNRRVVGVLTLGGLMPQDHSICLVPHNTIKRVIRVAVGRWNAMPNESEVQQRAVMTALKRRLDEIKEAHRTGPA